MKISKNLVNFLILILLYITIYIWIFPEDAYYPDMGSYISLAYDLSQGGYGAGLFFRGITIPLLIYIGIQIGLSLTSILYIYPFLFGLLLIISTYYMSDIFSKYKTIPVLVLLSTFSFWQWTPFLLADILFAAFFTFSLYFFYRFVSNSTHYVYFCLFFTLLSVLTKVTAWVLFPIYITYLIYSRNLSLIKNKDVILSLILFSFLISSIFLYFSSLYGGLGLTSSIPTKAFYKDISYYIFNFLLIPWTYIFVYGLFKLGKKIDNKTAFILISFIIPFVFLHLINEKIIRYILFIFPVFAIFIEMSFRKIALNKRKIIFYVFLIFAMLQVFMISIPIQDIYGGAGQLTDSLKKTESIIATNSVMVYDQSFSGRLVSLPINGLNSEWIENNNISYVVLSLTDEITQNPDITYYKPKIGPFDISLLLDNRPKFVMSWWVDYPFNSENYLFMDNNYLISDIIKKNNKTIFLIYKIS
ncbi:MAG: glycosyltransferase family 39 protein [DPANN group archaeon]|nr:glycosyltransferase family 39 protein [DPANN group archaeon]